MNPRATITRAAMSSKASLVCNASPTNNSLAHPQSGNRDPFSSTLSVKDDPHWSIDQKYGGRAIDTPLMLDQDPWSIDQG